MEQIGILCEGYGFKDLAFKKQKNGVACCDVCGYEYGSGSQVGKGDVLHEEHHFTKIRKKLGRGQYKKPAKAPMPPITVKRVPPVLNVDQQANPLPKYIARVAARAKRMVEAGVVKATIIKLADMTVPELNKGLVGKKIEYVFRINRTATSRSELYPYTGIVKSVQLHTPNPKAKARDRGRKSKSKSKSKQEPASTSVPGTVPSAMVEWLNAGGGAKDESRVILVRELYGAVDKEDGWLISGLDDDDNSAFGPIEMSVEEQMHWSAIKAEFLCPKM